VTIPARSRFADVLGLKAHYLEAGDGPPVLLLHGYLHSAATWRKVLPGLAERFRVLALDQVGTGKSDRGPWDWSIDGLCRFVEAFLDAAGVPALHAAVGNSLGGATVLRLALAAPGRVGRLVLVDSAGLRAHLPPVLRLFGLPGAEPWIRRASSFRPLARALLARWAYPRGPVDDETLAGFVDGFSVPGTFAAAASIARAFPASSAALDRRLPELDVPALVVWGERDRLLPLAAGRRLAGRIPGARLEVMAGCGHCPQEEDPAGFLELLRGFL
jgi:pimeloyl-ACP methyl ester carboxylesterase